MSAKKLRQLVSFWGSLLVAGALWAVIGRAGEFDARKVQAAAEKGDSGAEFLLGRAYDTGQGMPRNEAKALEYYRKAANHGNPMAQNNLASLYASGTGGVQQDQAEARKWLRKAAEQGAALAQDNLGLMLLQANGAEAAQWFEKSAAQGFLAAQLHLGNLYYNGGSGIEKDYAKAAKWMRKAAEQKSPWAENILGVMYENGYGVPRDPTAARGWFQHAAEQGDAKAQSNLGQLLCSGNGVQTKPEEGYKWLTLSAEHREVTAVKFLNDFQTGMTPEQIAAGKKLVQEYKLRQRSGPPDKKD